MDSLSSLASFKTGAVESSGRGFEKCRKTEDLSLQGGPTKPVISYKLYSKYVEITPLIGLITTVTKNLFEGDF